jgi:hypothetical protein
MNRTGHAHTHTHTHHSLFFEVVENCSTHFGLELWEDPFLHEALRNLVLDLCEAHGCELVERVEVLLPSDCGGDDVGPDVYSTAGFPAPSGQ